MQTKTLRSFTTILVTVLVSAAWSQGGGYGGGLGGGMGGGNMGRMKTAEGEPATFTHILTPGDRGEWPFTAKDGETIIARASSTAFDPAIEVINDKGQKIADNDDVEPGIQDAQVLVHFPKAGSFKVLVKGYKSAGGGQYTFTVRRFVATDLKIGERNAGRLTKDAVRWLRFKAEVGQTVVLSGQAATFSPATEVFGPGGDKIEVRKESFVYSRSGRSVIKAKQAGDYYVKLFGGVSGAGYALTVAPATVAAIAIGETKSGQKLEAGGLTLWRFKGTEGDLVRIEAKAAGVGLGLSLDFLPEPAKDSEETVSTDPSEELLEMPLSGKERGTTTILIKKTGTVQVSIAQRLCLATEYSFAVTKPAKPWKDGEELNARLALGESDYWTFNADRGQIIRLQGWAEQFDLTLRLYSMHGDTVADNDDGAGGTNPLATALIQEPGQHILVAKAVGNGGSGAYRLRRGPAEVRRLAVNSRETGSVGLDSVEIWSFEGKAGQDVAISVRSDEFNTVMQAFGPDALEVAHGGFFDEDANSLVSVRLPLDGTYTIWVCGSGGGGKYTIRWIDLDR